MNQSPPTLSLIATVKNEANTIRALLDSILGQSLPPDEIVINDDMSDDDTLDILQAYAQREPRLTVVRGGGRISAGRNRAIGAASGSIIACCDAGTVLGHDWFRSITEPILNGDADIVGGHAVLTHRSIWELALGITTLRDAAEIEAKDYLPAGNSVAFTREAWAFADGFPTWAKTCEDLIFAIERKQAGFHFAFAPDATVLFRPRANPSAFFRQYFYYAHGDGVARLWPYRHALRYAAYLGLTGLLTAAFNRQGWAIGLLIVGGGVYSRRPLQRLAKRWPDLSYAERLAAPPLIPAVRLIGDVAKMAGYIFGRIQSARPHQSR